MTPETHKFSDIYKGIVVDNKDPRDIGRVKVHVPGVYPDFDNEDQHISKSALPWAQPMLSLFNSGGDNLKSFSREEENYENGYQYNKTGTSGIYTVPGQGSHVYVFFENGDHMHPVYMGADPNESDWLTQKMMIKDRVNLKIAQIADFKERFSPVDASTGTDGDGWGDGAHVNARMGAEGEGEATPYGADGDGENNATDGESEIRVEDVEGGPYAPVERAFSNSQENGDGYEREDEVILTPRATGSVVSLDVKPLLDGEEVEGDIDRSGFPHEYGESFDPIAGTGEDAANPSSYDRSSDRRHINRDLTSIVTKGGTTIVIDNREDEENFYLIHKNYLFNIDEFGSVKEFCGQNNVEQPREPNYNGETEEDGLQDTTDESVAANKELGVTGSYKIHVIGNFSTYTKGNAFMQVDKNMQLDVNDSYGVRVRKGDVDIIIEGEDEDSPRDEGTEGVEGAKEEQYGDLNVAVKNGNIEVYCKDNANIHVGGQCNLRVEGDMKVHARKNYHLLVEGNYHEFINGKKFSTVVDRADYYYKKNRRTIIEKNDRKIVQEKNEVTAEQHISKGDWHFDEGEIRVDNDIHLIGNFRCRNSLRVLTLEVDEDVKIKGNTKVDGEIYSLEEVTACGSGKGVKLSGHKHKIKKLKVKGRKRRGSKKVTGRTKKGKTKKPKKVGTNCSPVQLSPFLLPEEPDSPNEFEHEGSGLELPSDEIYEADDDQLRRPVESEETSGNEISVALRTHDDRSFKENIESAVPQSGSSDE
jgi:hypothetical protein